MNKLLSRAAFVAGLLAIGWVGAGYLRSHPLALAMTLAIGAFYLMGARELRRYAQDTDGLAQALGAAAEPPPSLADWLARVPAALRHTVRLRVEGERAALPGPALTPYLAGLLVLLGMLGTFTGMVITLAGTGVALEQATDLKTMRDSLAAPVKGLGLAFGTSVAGVAASAMLGLMSTLCRRERQQAGQRLDALAGSSLRAFTQAHQREQSLALQQQQAQLVPVLAERLQGLMTQLEAQAAASNAQLLASQERFQAQAEAAYRGLADSVDRTLQRSLSDSARLAAATLQPLAEATMGGIARETAALHGEVAGAVQQQLDGVSRRFEAATQAVTATWQGALEHHAQTSDAMASRLGATLERFGQRFEERVSASWQDTAERLDRQSGARDAERLAAWSDAMHTMAAALQAEWQQAGAQAASQQAQVCATLEQAARRIGAEAEAQAGRTLAEIARLVAVAGEAPRAAAEVVAQLREKLSDSLANDNAMLAERQRVMATLNTLLDAVQHTTAGQKAAIDTLIASTAARLEQAGARFGEKVDAESARLDAVAAQLTGSAVDVASLGEAFATAVELFSQTSQQLMGHLQRVDDTLVKAGTRSDEQLAYYVAQARELIDLSLLHQKQIVDDLQRVAAGSAA